MYDWAIEIIDGTNEIVVMAQNEGDLMDAVMAGKVIGERLGLEENYVITAEKLGETTLPSTFHNVPCPQCGHIHPMLDFTTYPDDLWPAVYAPCDRECGFIFTEEEAKDAVS